MNESQRKLNNIRISMNEVDTMKPLYKNCVRTNSSNTDSHEDMKWKICRQLCKEGKDYYTECVLKGNVGRVDILVPEDAKIIEVLCSETDKSFAEKIKKYPASLEIIKVKASDEFNEKLIY